jgi:phosphatidate cytidylyltransferase
MNPQGVKGVGIVEYISRAHRHRWWDAKLSGMSHLAPEVRTILCLILALLAVANAIPSVLKYFNPDRDFQKLSHQLRTWLVIAGIVSFFVAISPTATVVFFGFVSYLALKEFFSMTPTRRADRRVLFWAYLAVIVQYFLVGREWFGMFLVFIPVIMFAWLPTRMWLIGHTDGFLRAAGSMHWGLMVTVFCISHAAFLMKFKVSSAPLIEPHYPSLVGQAFPGPGLLVFLLLTTEMNDIFEKFWGKALGVHRLAPTINRRRTDAGLIGGAMSTILLALIIGPLLTLMDIPRALIAGLLIAVAGFAGDLCMSALKRDLKIQNFGATLPGHGGVLDRADSLVFTAPLFFHFVHYYYGS